MIIISCNGNERHEWFWCEFIACSSDFHLPTIKVQSLTSGLPDFVQRFQVSLSCLKMKINPASGMAFTPGFSRPKGLACQFLGRGSIRICVIVTVSPLSCRVSCNISLVKDRFSQFTYRKWSTLGWCRWLPGCSKNANQISQKKSQVSG